MIDSSKKRSLLVGVEVQSLCVIERRNKGTDVTSIQICVSFLFLTEFGVHLAELTVDRQGALAIRQVSFNSAENIHTSHMEGF